MWPIGIVMLVEIRLALKDPRPSSQEVKYAEIP